MQSASSPWTPSRRQIPATRPPEGAADIATVLFTRYLELHPKTPPGRTATASSCRPAMVHAALFAVYLTATTTSPSRDQNFRQLGSRTAGHPNTATPPASRRPRSARPGALPIPSAWRFAERKLQRGVRQRVDGALYLCAGRRRLPDGRHHQEAIALAGHLKLQQVIVFWGRQQHSIDGSDLHWPTRPTSTPASAPANGTRSPSTAHDPEAIAAAIEEAQKSDKPTMIACKTRDRLRCAEQGRHAQGPRLPARRRGNRRHPQGARAGKPSVSRFPQRARRLAHRRPAVAKARKEWEERLEAAEAEKKAQFVRRFSGELEGSLASAIAPTSRSLPRPSPRRRREGFGGCAEVINGVLAETIGGSAA